MEKYVVGDRFNGGTEIVEIVRKPNNEGELREFVHKLVGRLTGEQGWVDGGNLMDQAELVERADPQVVYIFKARAR